MTTIADFITSILESNRQARLSILALNTDPQKALSSRGFEKALPNPADRIELAKSLAHLDDADTEVREVARLLGVGLDGPATSNDGVIREAFVKFARERRDSCKNTFGGGYKTAEEREIFHHGIDTVFNVIEGHANGQRQDY